MPKLNDDILVIASEIEFDLLLEEPLTADATIRFICAVRKSLLNADPTGLNSDLRDLEQRINRLYDRIGYDRRHAAYENAKRSAALVQTPPPVLEIVPPPVRYAEPFTIEVATSLAKDFVCDCIVNDKETFTYGDAKAFVKTAHLEGGKEWLPSDNELQKSRQTRWEATLSSALLKLRAEELIFYSNKRGCYVIVDDIS